MLGMRKSSLTAQHVSPNANTLGQFEGNGFINSSCEIRDFEPCDGVWDFVVGHWLDCNSVGNCVAAQPLRIGED